MLRKALFSLGLVVTLAVFSNMSVSPAWAQQGDMSACAGDIAKFCANVQKGGGRIIRCLDENSSTLSPSCKVHIDDIKKRFAQRQQDCKGDVSKFCSGVEPGGGHIIKCLHEHISELSPACAAHMR